MNNQPIGIFDSGVGGLTVASAVMEVMPREEIIYFGDTARVPYGTKSAETVTRFSRQIIRFLLSKNVKVIIAACNTVSAVSLKQLRKDFDIPIFGVVEPGVDSALAATKNNKVGIIGTAATIKSGAYENIMHEKNGNIEVFSQACPLFVPLAEEGWEDTLVSKLTAEKYLEPLVEKGIDSLVLGCTHYPLLYNCIKSVAGENIELVNPAKATAQCVYDYLISKNELNEEDKIKEHKFYVSDMTDKLDIICKKTLKNDFPLEKIDIERY
ncbi:MAG: glutamate racemase [Firmicutes bacterium]|nr:glutamate racemase [Bacillota bacterium]MBR2594273.1 glutamate racemase [Bacillota bacterium]